MRLNGRDQADRFLALSELIIDEELCINLRGRMAHCTDCRDSCPTGALTLTPDSVDLDVNRCTGCNSCLPSCKAGVFCSSGFVPERFLRALAGREAIDLHCRGSSDDGGGIVIPCHTVLDARLIAASRAEGVKGLSLHGLNNCERCTLGDARAHVASLRLLLQDWLGDAAPVIGDFPHPVEERDGRLHQDQRHVSRRDFLRLGGAKAVSQAVDWLVPGSEQGEDDGQALPFYQASEYPQRASPYQQAFSSRVDRIPWQASASYSWPARTVSGSCSGCLSCGVRCPTGALQAIETQQTRQLSFDPMLCTDCTLCLRICPEKAITASSLSRVESMKSERHSLLCLQQRPCRQCDMPFIAEEPGMACCQMCRNEQELDDAWLEMLRET
ncbi:MAG: 4Fe-4S dicluster domain-containing protein [Candidatus Thiodiazotropha sp. (ex Dulcina madagascariensis)]|nr:4Fe-4S dicluster domain-containing protein [Candidatus Thiodiazotropha sp. (ex Dulcina madagascariensis)]